MADEAKNDTEPVKDVTTVEKTTTTEAVVTEPAKMVSVDADLYRKYLDAEQQVKNIEREKQAQLDAKEREKTLALIAKGEGEKALQSAEDRHQKEILAANSQIAALTERIHNDAKLNVIMDNIPLDRFLSPEAMIDARSKLANRLEVIMNGDSLVVREKGTGRNAKDAISEALTTKDFTYFLRPTNKGGAGSSGDKPGNNESKQEQISDAEANLLRLKSFQNRAKSIDPLATLGRRLG